MIYMRGQARDYDQWRQMGNRGWGWDDVLPVFRRSEDHVHGGDRFHGTGGEWRVEEQRLSWEILDAFREACLQTGIPATDDFNRGDNEGVGYFQVNQRRGVRWSAAGRLSAPGFGPRQSHRPDRGPGAPADSPGAARDRCVLHTLRRRGRSHGAARGGAGFGSDRLTAPAAAVRHRAG